MSIHPLQPPFVPSLTLTTTAQTHSTNAQHWGPQCNPWGGGQKKSQQQRKKENKRNKKKKQKKQKEKDCSRPPPPTKALERSPVFFSPVDEISFVPPFWIVFAPTLLSYFLSPCLFLSLACAVMQGNATELQSFFPHQTLLAWFLLSTFRFWTFRLPRITENSLAAYTKENTTPSRRCANRCAV